MYECFEKVVGHQGIFGQLTHGVEVGGRHGVGEEMKQVLGVNGCLGLCRRVHFSLWSAARLIVFALQSA